MGDKALSESIMALFIEVYSVTGPHWASLWPSDAIWWQGSGSTLVQVMACCLMAPSHYPNQYWLIISEVQWHSPEGNFTRDITQPSITKFTLKINNLKSNQNLPGANELTHILSHTVVFIVSHLFRRKFGKYGIVSICFFTCFLSICFFHTFGPFNYHGFILIPAWVSNKMPRNV